MLVWALEGAEAGIASVAAEATERAENVSAQISVHVSVRNGIDQGKDTPTNQMIKRVERMLSEFLHGIRMA
jgi:ribosome-binding protein aMBF1 (putative translation factor)